MRDLSAKAEAVLSEIPWTWTRSEDVFKQVASMTGMSKRSLAQIYRALHARDLIRMRKAEPLEDGFIRIRRCRSRFYQNSK